MIVGRRGFIAGLAAAFAAPAIVRVEALMPIRGVPLYTGGNSLLTINQITREAVKLFYDSNVSLREITQYDGVFETSRVDVLYGSLEIRPEWALKLAGHPPYVYNKELRTLLPNVPDLQLPIPVAIAAGAVAVAAKNPMVSRRFWSRAA